MAPRASSLIVTTAAALVSAVWISVCAAAPEFIWQGLRIALGHISGTMLLSALLLGFILAFFVEPLMERLRRLSHAAHAAPELHATHPLFTAALSLAFALVSICLHDALTAFVLDSDHGGGHSGLAGGFELTIAWAMVPFATTLAWLSARQRALAVPLGVLAAVAPALAAWLFDWTLQDAINTTAPCLTILLLGYRERTHRGREMLAACARIVVLVAVSWFAIAALFDLVSARTTWRFQLYEAEAFWMDVRFYLGWAIGLWLAPAPVSPSEPR